MSKRMGLAQVYPRQRWKEDAGCEAECPPLAAPPPFSPTLPAFALLTLAVFVHSMAFINVFIYTLHRLCSM